MNIVTQSYDRIIAFGDIHGTVEPLKTVLLAIKPQPNDLLIFLGDLVDRGQNTKSVIDTVIDLSQTCTVHTILGNHEEMILGAIYGGESEVRFWKKFGGLDTLRSYGADDVRGIDRRHLLFIADCKDYIETENFIFVHAGCNPDSELKDTSGAILRWEKDPKQPHISQKTIVYGHIAGRQIVDQGFAIGIDTGCGIWDHGRLTAIDLKSGTIWQAGSNSKKATVKKRK